MIRTKFFNASRRILACKNIVFREYSVNAEVEVLSRETIKPSSPTPLHLRTYNISLLDHLYASTYIPIFLSYNNPTTISQNEMIQNELPKFKQALSETLARFYPLAGRLNENNRQINCNDQGVVLCTTRVKNYNLADLLKIESKISAQLGLFPMQPWVPPNETSDYAQVAIQLNLFNCGGIGLGIIFSHKIIDASTVFSFLKCWADISKGDDDKTCPNYLASWLYPMRKTLPDDLFRVFFVENLLLKKGDTSVNKKFLFDAKAIASLRSKATSENVPRPSRFETLSCFIWKRAMDANKVVLGGQVNSPSAITFHVDLRRKMTPPLPKCTVGNLLWSVGVFCDKDVELNSLVKLSRAELKKINEFVPKSRGYEGYAAICESLRELREFSRVPNLDAYLFTSWIGVGFYEVDFGWGKPIKVGFMGTVADLKVKNKIYLIEAGNNDENIEAYITMDPSKMAILENDPEFLTFASPT